MTGSVLQSDEPITDTLMSELVECGLIEGTRGAILRAAYYVEEPGGGRTDFLEFLVRSGVLTRYQADRVLEGETHRLVVGPYRLRQVIGPSSLGTLYRTEPRDGAGTFAILILPLRSIWNAHLAKKQVDVHATLPVHPGLVPLIDVDTSNGMHYLSWKDSEGETLEGRVTRSGPMPLGAGVRFLARLAELLALCHRSGVVHGTLRPGVVQFNPEGLPRLLELGVGTILAENIVSDDSFLDTISTANAAALTIDCTAPETTLDPSQRTPAGDQYSLGCLAHLALTGSYPFPEGTVVDKMIAHTSRAPDSLAEKCPAAPAELVRAVDRLLSKAPVDRFPDMAAAAQALAGIAVDCPEVTQQTPPPARVDIPSPVPDGPELKGENELEPVESPTPDPGGAITFDLPVEKLESEPTSGRVKRKDRSSARIDLPPSKDALSDPGAGLPAVKPIILKGKSGTILETPHPRLWKPPSDVPAAEAPPVPVAWQSPEPPVQYGTGVDEPPVSPPSPPHRPNAVVRFVKRAVLFWKPATEPVQLSVYGPCRLVNGQTAKVQAYAHPPAAFASVRTLARAFLPDADLIVTGYLEREIPRGQPVSLHLFVGNAGVSESLLSFTWVGQTIPRTFSVFVPWESPAGRTQGVLSAGIDGIQVAAIPFHLELAQRLS